MRRFVTLLAIAVAYYVSARAGLRLALVDDIVTPLWPPTGVAVFALARYGVGSWPALAVAAFAVNVGAAGDPVTAAIIAVGNTLAPVVAVTLLRRLGFRHDLARLRDALILVGVALVSMTISATVGTTSLVLAGNTGAIDTWWVWWTGDAMGVLIVAPVLWCIRLRRGERLSGARAFEVTALMAGLTAAGLAAAFTDDGLLFTTLPFLCWIAWRFQQAGAAPAGLLASTIVTLAAANDLGLFEGQDLTRGMVVLQCFNASVAMTSFFFAAAVTDRRAAMQALYERERHIAETLQSSMLPKDLPTIDGLALAARYLSSSESEIGGDWYDVIQLPGERIGLVVGDVAGHGLEAASAMAQLRMALRAHVGAASGPADVLRLLNGTCNQQLPGLLATVLYAELDVGTGQLLVASAGHMPPLVVSGPGAAFLDVGHSPPLGAAEDLEMADHEHFLSRGWYLLLFTDGLVERRREAMDDRLEQLRSTCVDLRAVDIDDLCRGVIERMLPGDVVDDVALLALCPVGTRVDLAAPKGGRTQRPG